MGEVGADLVGGHDGLAPADVGQRPLVIAGRRHGGGELGQRARRHQQGARADHGQLRVVEYGRRPAGPGEAAGRRQQCEGEQVGAVLEPDRVELRPGRGHERQQRRRRQGQPARRQRRQQGQREEQAEPDQGDVVPPGQPEEQPGRRPHRVEDRAAGAGGQVPVVEGPVPVRAEQARECQDGGEKAKSRGPLQQAARGASRAVGKGNRNLHDATAVAGDPVGHFDLEPVPVGPDVGKVDLCQGVGAVGPEAGGAITHVEAEDG